MRRSLLLTLLAFCLSSQLLATGGSLNRLSWGPYEYLSNGYRNAPWVNDPFFPDARAFQLMGMVSDEMAFINGKWFKIGDTIDGYTIKAISTEGVVLMRRSDIIKLKMRE